MAQCLWVSPVQGRLDAEAMRGMLNDRWARGGPWEVRQIHRDGLLAVGTCAEGVKAAAEAGVLTCGGLILRIQAWTSERGTFPTPGRTTLCIRFMGVPTLLRDELALGFLGRTVARVQVESFKLVPEGHVNCVEALVEVASPPSNPSCHPRRSRGHGVCCKDLRPTGAAGVAGAAT